MQNAILSLMKKPNIVLIGHVCIDHNTTENATYTSWGSSVLYIANYLQTAYFTTPLISTSYGPDILPYVPEVNLLPDKPNEAQTLLYENDTSVIPRVWRAHNTQFAQPPDITPQLIQALNQADIIMVATLLPNYGPEYIAELLGHGKPAALKVLCPQGYLRHVNSDGLVESRDFTEAAELIPQFDLVIYSEEDHPQALEIGRTWQSSAPNTHIIITQGEKGASIIEQDTTTQIPTTPLDPEEIVDSVGCGDVFDAAVSIAYYQSRDLPAAVKLAHIAAAKKLLNTTDDM
jgi:hypothetical protein